MSHRYFNSRIGFDLDNTLITYDRVFLELALERGFVPANFIGSKRDIRDRVLSLVHGDFEWQRMQAQAYGPGIAGANVAEGALEFIRQARGRGADLMIVSHKTVYSNFGSYPVNLRHAASRLLRETGIVGGYSVPESSVYFEESRSKKLTRIKSLNCTHFIDDLEEVLNDKAFPSGVVRMLLNASTRGDTFPYSSYTSFKDITRDFSD